MRNGHALKHIALSVLLALAKYKLTFYKILQTLVCKHAFRFTIE